MNNTYFIWGGLLVMPNALEAQTNKVQNFSFEQAGAPSQAASWNPEWGGYERVALATGGWDGAYAIKLSGNETSLLGASQRIYFNQKSHAPIRISMQVKGVGIANAPNDNLGASFDCRVKFVSLTLSQLSYCPTTSKTKNTGSFYWRLVGINTTDLVNGSLPIEWVEVRLRRGAVPGTAFFDDVHVAEYWPGTFFGAVTFMFDDCYK